jgi:hypothetical protein
MMFTRRAGLCVPMLSLALVSGACIAQISSPAAGAPSVPSTQVYPLSYSSSFHGYLPYQAQKIEPWKAANDKVKDIGGWRVYTREGAQPDAEPASMHPPAVEQAAPAVTPPPAPKAPSHQHHAGPQGATK